jgi:carbamoyl-phosphate synthase large subunit
VIQDRSINAVIPGTQAELDIFSKAEVGSIPATLIQNAPHLAPLAMSKMEMFRTLSNHGFPVIATHPLTEWELLAHDYDFPFIAKPISGSGGSNRVRILTSREEVLHALHSSPEGCLCVQPYVGSGDDEYTVGVATQCDGQMIDSIVMKRHLAGLSLQERREVKGVDFAISTGFSQGFIVDRPDIQGFAESVALKLDSRGPLNLQLRIVDGIPLIFDFHPRFSGTTPMRADAGFNEVDILLRNFLDDETFGRISYRRNMVAIISFEHVMIPFERYEEMKESQHNGL